MLGCHQLRTLSKRKSNRFLRIVKRLTSLAVPYDGSFTLIGDTNCLDLTGRETFLGKQFDSFFDAARNG